MLDGVRLGRRRGGRSVGPRGEVFGGGGDVGARWGFVPCVLVVVVTMFRLGSLSVLVEGLLGLSRMREILPSGAVRERRRRTARFGNARSGSNASTNCGARSESSERLVPP